MKIDLDLLTNLMEETFFLLPEIKGQVAIYKRQGLEGRITNLSDHYANIIGKTRLNIEDSERIIDEVCSFFQDQNKHFSWIIGPKTSPKNLGEILLRKGFIISEEISGMVKFELNESINNNSNISIQKINASKLNIFCKVMSESYPTSYEVARFFTETTFYSQNFFKSEFYLAYIDQNENPVGYGILIYIPGFPVVLLGGSGTVPEYRNKGIYTELTKRRLEDASKEGMLAAIIQASTKTSAPICKKLGFNEFCQMKMFAHIK